MRCINQGQIGDWHVFLDPLSKSAARIIAVRPASTWPPSARNDGKAVSYVNQGDENMFVEK